MAEVHQESAGKFAHYLKGLRLPASKSDLKAEATKHNAPNEVLKLINVLPERSFQTMPDIMKAIGEVERKH
jgi:hypothetical protein